MSLLDRFWIVAIMTVALNGTVWNLLRPRKLMGTINFRWWHCFYAAPSTHPPLQTVRNARFAFGRSRHRGGHYYLGIFVHRAAPRQTHISKMQTLRCTSKKSQQSPHGFPCVTMVPAINHPRRSFAYQVALEQTVFWICSTLPSLWTFALCHHNSRVSPINPPIWFCSIVQSSNSKWNEPRDANLLAALPNTAYLRICFAVWIMRYGHDPLSLAPPYLFPLEPVLHPS